VGDNASMLNPVRHELRDATYYQLTFSDEGDVASFNAFCDSSCGECAVMERVDSDCEKGGDALCGCASNQPLPEETFQLDVCQQAALDLPYSYFARKPVPHQTSRVCVLESQAMAGADDASITVLDYPYDGCDTESGGGDKGAAISWTHSGDNECHQGYYYEQLKWYRIESKETSAMGYACDTQTQCEATNVTLFAQDGSLFPNCFALPGLSSLSGSTNGTSFNTCQHDPNDVDQVEDFKYVQTSGIGVSVANDNKAMDGTIPLCFAMSSTTTSGRSKGGSSVPIAAVVGGIVGAVIILVIVAVIVSKRRRAASYETLTGQSMYAGE